MESIELPVIIQRIIEYLPVIIFLVVFFTFKSKMLPTINKLIFKTSLMTAMTQIKQNPEEFKKNEMISEVADKDKMIREFQKFKKIKKIEIPKAQISSNPNNSTDKERIYEATIMTLDGMDHVFRFVTKQQMLNSAYNSRENALRFKLISFQQIS